MECLGVSRSLSRSGMECLGVSRSLAWSEWSEERVDVFGIVARCIRLHHTMNLKLDGTIAVTHSLISFL